MHWMSTLRTATPGELNRPIVKGLFVASCLLSVVSYYTTQQGMALYLSGWFSVLASLGIQLSLILVAWLIGVSKGGRLPLIGVYAIGALVSIGFSYVSLYSWFSARERPAQVQRALYDRLGAVAAQADQLLAAAIAEARRHVLALEEMSLAEKQHGYISQAHDTDPYLSEVRKAVASEAKTLAGVIREGSGEGPRYTAFDRYLKISEQSLAQMEASKAALAAWRAKARPVDASEQQLRSFHKAYDAIPWPDMERTLHSGALERPQVPAYSDFVDVSSGGQEDLLLAFTELFSAPNSRHSFSLTLAAFIDVIVFLLAFTSGPYFLGNAEQRWFAAGATLDAVDKQLFLKAFLRKLEPGPHELPRVEVSTLTAGEQQFCLQLAAKGMARGVEEDGKRYYVLHDEVHENLLESLDVQALPLRADADRARVNA
jgi:Na+/melibiose symporter and related transporters